MRFKPLPASAGELDEVVALWNAGDGGSVRASRLRGASAPRNDVVRLEGAAAGEAAFKAAAPGRRGLHLATHGFFLGGSCASALDPGVAEAVVYEDRNLAENPLLLSGFALAGANLREEAGEGEEDGILTAEEIASIDLSGVEWAVLSACNTGVGEIRAGEGVFGLRRAFRVAGVETLIMSLWPVEDEASRDWMTTFYGLRFEKGLGIAGAVHTASFETLNARRAEGQSTHPFFWAAFVAAGR
jgi:CHAT domain-containing protein